MNYTYIDNIDELINFRNNLNKENITEIAMDFEAECNLHSYGEKLCLIQVFDGNNFFVIDPLKIDDAEIIKTLNNKKIIKYMYGAGSDISLIYRQYGIKLTSVFDQQILVDVLEFKNKGLDSIIKQLFSVENNHKAKYQKYNWMKRPINEDAIIYALNDVKYLFEINKILTNKIIDENKINKLILGIIKNNFDFEKEKVPGIFKKIEYKKLSEEDKKKFKNIYEIREKYAKLLNIPAHNIIENNILFDIINRKVNINEIKFNKRIPNEIMLKIKNEIKLIFA
jgi:ribonuclease D